jgi:IS5 family transposase
MDLDHRIRHRLDETEALLDGAQIEQLLSSIYDSKTGRPSYPLVAEDLWDRLLAEVNG